MASDKATSSKRNYSSVFNASACITLINIPLPEANHMAQPKVSRVRMVALHTLLVGPVELHAEDLNIILFRGGGWKNRTIYFATVGNNDNSGDSDKIIIVEGSCLSPSFLTLSCIHPEIFILNGNGLTSWSHWNVLFFFLWTIEEHFVGGGEEEVSPKHRVKGQAAILSGLDNKKFFTPWMKILSSHFALPKPSSLRMKQKHSTCELEAGEGIISSSRLSPVLKCVDIMGHRSREQGKW